MAKNKKNDIKPHAISFEKGIKELLLNSNLREINIMSSYRYNDINIELERLESEKPKTDYLMNKLIEKLTDAYVGKHTNEERIETLRRFHSMENSPGINDMKWLKLMNVGVYPLGGEEPYINVMSNEDVLSSPKETYFNRMIFKLLSASGKPYSVNIYGDSFFECLDIFIDFIDIMIALEKEYEQK